MTKHKDVLKCLTPVAKCLHFPLHGKALGFELSAGTDTDTLPVSRTNTHVENTNSP